MIDYDTILSTTEDKLTLLQWLKKVEAALKDASATTFKVNKKGNATLTFSIVFADGSELESGEIVLQQGESVVSGEIVNGHLLLTLSNGDVLDTGTLFNGNINIAGNLSVTGKLDVDVITSSEDEITAEKPVIEVMTGYSVGAGNAQFDISYVGICKNGNKLTIAISGSLTPTTGYADEIIAIKTLNMPSNIGALIVPQQENRLIMEGVSLVANSSNPSQMKKAIVYLTKWNDTSFTIYMGLGEVLTPNTSYFFRTELTFLLSDNLA